MPRQRRNRLKELTNPTENHSGTRKSQKSRGPARSWSRRLFLLFALLMVVFAVLPNLICWTGMHQPLINWSTQGLSARITVDRMTAGWLQPLTLNGVTATDSSGNPLLTADSIITSNRLASLVWTRDIGSIMIQRPVLTAVLREGSSNLEDALAARSPTPNTPATPTAPFPKLNIMVRDGTIHLATDRQANPQTLGGIHADITTGGNSALAINASLRNGTAPDGGTVSVEMMIDAGGTQLLAENGQLKLNAERFDLAALAPVIERVAGNSQSGGILSGKIEASFAKSGQTIAAEFSQASIQNLQFVAANLFGPDRVAINNFVATGQASMNPQGINARNLDISSDVGNVRANGEMAWTQLTRMVSEKQLAGAPFQLDGKLNLARLASMLPGTLTLHNDLEFESGELKFTVNSRTDNGIPRVVANVDTVNLAARRAGQRIVWQQPLRFVSSVSQQDGQLQVEDLLCESDFLTIRGNGNLAAAGFTITGDLQKLMERLRMFATLDGWQLAGTIHGQITCKTESGNTIQVSTANLLDSPIRIAGEITVVRPVLQFPGLAPWTEPQMRMVIGASAQSTDAGLMLNQGLSQIHLGEDLVSLRLTEPVESVAKMTDVKLEATVQGNLARWVGFVRNFVDIGTFRTDGTGQATAFIHATPGQISATGLNYGFNQFTFDGYGMTIREDQVTGQGGIDFDLATSTLTARNLTLISSSVAALANGTSLTLGDHWIATGPVGLRGDVHRIAGWFGLSDPEDTVQYFGSLEGNVALSSTDQFIDGRIQGVITDMVAARPDYANRKWIELLREPKVNLAGTVGLAQSFNDLRLADVNVQANSVSAKVNGMVRDLAETCNMEIEGTWSPDWKQVEGVLAAYTGNMVQLAGRDTQAFTVRGPLFSPALAGQPATSFLPASTRVATELKWDQGKVFLLPVGPAKISAGLEGSVVRADTGEIAFGGGTFSLKPEIDLLQSSPVVRIGPGPIASQVQLTPEFCRDWMKYVAPLLADVTTVQGSFSVKTGGVAIPFDNPSAATATGAVTLHQVTVGAGPLAQQLLQTVESVRTLLKPDAGPAKDRSVWMNLGEQEVPFAVRDGRVFHDGLRLQAKDLQVTTRGSVGLDQTLQMVAVIPIHDDWLNGQQWLEGLRGQSLEIPIAGTVSNPVLDPRAVQQLATQLLQRTAQNELNRVVGEQTQKLQNKATEELNQLQNKIQGKFEEDVKGKLQGEMQKGLEKLFGPKTGTGGGTTGGG